MTVSLRKGGEGRSGGDVSGRRKGEKGKREDEVRVPHNQNGRPRVSGDLTQGVRKEVG